MADIAHRGMQKSAAWYSGTASPKRPFDLPGFLPKVQFQIDDELTKL
jgi:hypothetical protein